VIGYQEKAHGMAVDAEDNLWICDANGATVMKLSPEGKLLMTIGSKGHRGDWNEAKGQRLLWQPLMVAFADKFVYANVACFPARKRLPSGGNAHCTIRPVRWWEEQLDGPARARPQVRYQFRLAYIKADELKEKLLQRC